jgi:hypothetical protein
MPSRLPDRNKKETVHLHRTVTVDNMVFFKGAVETDEVTAQKIRKELKQQREVRPFIERGTKLEAGEETEVEEPELPKNAAPKAKEHL